VTVKKFSFEEAGRPMADWPNDALDRKVIERQREELAGKERAAEEQRRQELLDAGIPLYWDTLKQQLQAGVDRINHKLPLAIQPIVQTTPNRVVLKIVGGREAGGGVTLELRGLSCWLVGKGLRAMRAKWSSA
jgi:hypothetical protein